MFKQILKQRLAIGLTVILILFSGIMTIYQLPRREIPIIEHPIALITTIYPGATASQVEKHVTGKLESELAGLTGINDITSISQAGLSQITLKADAKVNANELWNKVQQKIDLAQASFPEGVQESFLENDLQLQGVSIYQLVAPEEEDLYLLNNLLDSWESSFSKLPDIAQIQIQGLPAYEILIEIDAARMLASNLSPLEIMQAIQSEIAPSPPGKWNLDETIYQLRLNHTLDLNKLHSLPLAAASADPALHLGDVAKIHSHLQDNRQIVTYNGSPSVSVSFFASAGIDLVKADREISQLLGQLQEELPENIEVFQVYTQAHAISNMFKSLGMAFLLAILFVVLVSSSGLNRYASIGVAITIPLALCGAILILPLAKVDMNQITLIAFIIVLGILVDDAIVVNENISRYRIEGNPALASVIEGTRGVASSVIISTLIIIFAFSPLLFLSGGAGDFIRPLPTVIIAAIIASTLVALLVIPVYRYWLEERLQDINKLTQNGWLDSQLNHLQSYYEKIILPKVLAKPKRYVVFCLLISLTAYLLIPLVPKEFFPDVEREEIFIEIELPKSYSLTSTREKVGEIESYIIEQTGIMKVNTFYATIMPRIFGMSNANAVGTNSANMLIFIDNQQVKARQVKDNLAQELNREFPLAYFTFSVVESGPPIGAPMSIRLTGNSLEEIQLLSDEIKQVLLAESGVIGVKDDFGAPSPALVFTPNEAAMKLHNVSPAQIGQTLRLYGEGIKIGEIENGLNLQDIRLKYKGGLTKHSPDFTNLILFNHLGQAIPLGYVADHQTKLELEHISHSNYLRSNTIRAYLDSSTSSSKLENNLIPTIKQLSLNYPEIQLEYGGENVARTDAFIEIGYIFVVVIFLLILVIIIQFKSIPLALIIMTTVLLSSSGAIYSLFITRTPLGFMALMGVISLAGIVVRNGIILIEFMEQKVKAGMELITAVKLAGGQRLRPILLTVGTSFFGLMPIILGNNLLFRPLAICIAGGLLFSTIFTLILIPCAYFLYRRKKI